MIEKKIVIGKIEILEDGQIQVRTDTIYVDDGIEISRTYHRKVIAPGDDFSMEDSRVKKACTTFHDVETIKDFKGKLKVK